MTDDYKYKETTGLIIGAAMEVHKFLGNRFQEVIYQRSLKIEFEQNHIGTRRVDFLINDLIAIEIKAVSKLEDVHLAQAINYLEAYNLEIGLLINFGSKSLQFKRLLNSKFNPVNHISG